jgi:hypothetical protein
MGGDGGGGNKKKKMRYTHTQDRNEHGEYGNYGFEWQTGDFLCVYIFSFYHEIPREKNGDERPTWTEDADNRIK